MTTIKPFLRKPQVQDPYVLRQQLWREKFSTNEKISIAGTDSSIFHHLETSIQYEIGMLLLNGGSLTMGNNSYEYKKESVNNA